MSEAGRSGLALLAAALSFSLMAVCVKAVGQHLPVAEIVLARAAISLLLSGGLLWRAAIPPWGQRRGLLMLRGLLGSLALACVFGSLSLLPLAIATVLQFLYPTFSTLLGWLWLGERPGRSALVALPLGWLGVLLVCRPSGGALPVAGLALALAGALLTALTYGSVRRLGRSEHPLVIVFYFPLMALPLSLPWVLLDPVAPRPGDWLPLLGVGVFTQLGQLGLTQGLVHLPLARATAIGYGQVAFAALWGWILFGEPLAQSTTLGAGLVLAATLLSLPPAATSAAAAPGADGQTAIQLDARASQGYPSDAERPTG